MRSNTFKYNVLPVLLLTGLVTAALLLGGCCDDETLAPVSLDPVSPAVRANENAGSMVLPAFLYMPDLTGGMRI